MGNILQIRNILHTKMQIIVIRVIKKQTIKKKKTIQIHY